MKRLFALVIILAIVVASCMPPATPVPITPEPFVSRETEEPGRGPIVPVRGVGSGDGCAELDGSAPGLQGGPWTDEHQFPRLSASRGHYNYRLMVDAAGNINERAAMLKYFDLAKVVASAGYWYANACTSVDLLDYIHDANPKTKIVSTLHAYTISNVGDFSPVCSPTVHDLSLIHI